MFLIRAGAVAVVEALAIRAAMDILLSEVADQIGYLSSLTESYALPEERQEVYSPEMTEKEINQLAAALNKLRDGADLTEIKTDLAAIKTSQGWHKNIGWWAIGLAGVAAVYLFTLALIAIPRQIKTEIDKGRQDSKQDTSNSIAEATTPIRESLAGIKADLQWMREGGAKRLSQLMKENLVGGQDTDLGLRTVGALADKAREERSAVNPKGLTEVAEMMRKVGEQDPHLSSVAFGAVTSLASLRSTLNRSSAPDTTSATPATGDFKFEFTAKGKGPTLTFLGKDIPADKGVRAELLDHPNSENKVTPEYLIINSNGGTISLDGYFFRRVIFENAYIEYGGGSVKLENVYFVNCSFRFVLSKPSENLQNVIIASSSVDFSAAN